MAYLAGLIRLGHGAAPAASGIARWTAVRAPASCSPSGSATGLAGRRLGELEAFLPPADLGARRDGGELAWIVNDYERALAEAREGRAADPHRLHRLHLHELPLDGSQHVPEAGSLARAGALRARAPLHRRPRRAVSRAIRRWNRTLFGTVALPLYAVMTPEGKPVVYFSGLTRDPDEFLAFLRKGLEGF